MFDKGIHPGAIKKTDTPFCVCALPFSVCPSLCPLLLEQSPRKLVLYVFSFLRFSLFCGSFFRLLFLSVSFEHFIHTRKIFLFFAIKATIFFVSALSTSHLYLSFHCPYYSTKPLKCQGVFQKKFLFLQSHNLNHQDGRKKLYTLIIL